MFPGGTEIGMEIQRSLAPCKEVNLFSASQEVSNHAPYVFKNHSIVLPVTHKGWVESLRKVVRKYDIHAIFPAHDDVILPLLDHASKLHTKIVTSPKKTCVVTRSKTKTYSLLSAVVPCPKIFHCAEEIRSYPVFIKPDKGQGSFMALKIDDCESLKFFLKKRNDFLISEYLPGKEYTVDCFTDRRKGLLFCSARERVRVKDGISMHTSLVKSKEFEKFAKRISNKLPFYGAWFFQLKRDSKGSLKLLEIAPRIAGNMGLSRSRGVNLPLLSFFEQEGRAIEIMASDGPVEVDRCLTERYLPNLDFKTAYIDLDDTLVHKGKVNIELIQFLFQCVNNKIRLVLLTKHKGDIDTTLKKFKISGLFDSVILLKPGENKSEYITDKKSIFIDDSFSERRQVGRALGIKTFDGSMIGSLIDNRS